MPVRPDRFSSALPIGYGTQPCGSRGTQEKYRVSPFGFAPRQLKQFNPHHPRRESKMNRGRPDERKTYPLSRVVPAISWVWVRFVPAVERRVRHACDVSGQLGAGPARIRIGRFRARDLSVRHGEKGPLSTPTLDCNGTLCGNGGCV